MASAQTGRARSAAEAVPKYRRRDLPDRLSKMVGRFLAAPGETNIIPTSRYQSSATIDRERVSENELFPVSANGRNALVDEAGYQEMYRQSVDNPEEFWGDGKRIDWITPTGIKDVSRRRCAYPLVPRRYAERIGQLPRPPPGKTRRPGCNHLEGDNRRLQALTTESFTKKSAVLQCPQDNGVRATGSQSIYRWCGNRRRGAGLCPRWRDPFRDLRRVLTGFNRRAFTIPIPQLSSRPTKACAAAGRSR